MAALAVAAGPALTGCDIAGTVDIGNDAVTVDLSVTSRSGRCEVPVDSITTRRETLPDGRYLCRVSGVSPRTSGRDADDGWAHQLITWSSDHVFVLVPDLMTEEDGGIESIDVKITTPGPVLTVRPGPVPFGRTTRITDAEQVRTTGITLIASRHPALSSRAAALLAGTLLGLGIGAGLWWWSRRRVTARRWPP